MKIINPFFILIILYILFSTLNFEYYSEFKIEYIITTLLLFSSLYLNSISINNGRNKYFKSFLFYLFNISYFIKFNVISYIKFGSSLEIYKLVLLGVKFNSHIDVNNLFEAYSYSVIMYFACVISFICNDLSMKSHKTANRLNISNVSLKAFYFTLMLTISISVITTLLRVLFRESFIEPVIIVINTYFVPMMFCLLLVFVIRSSNTSSNKINIRRIRFVAILFIFSGLIQFSLLGSKLFVILPILFITTIAIHDEIRIFPVKTLFFVPVLIVIYPILNMYREALISGEASPLNSAFNIWLASDISLVSLGFLSLLHRFIGIESFATLLDARSTIYQQETFWSLVLGENSIAHILTYEILGYDFSMGVATSLFGQTYFIFGNIYYSIVMLFLLFLFLDRFVQYLNSSNDVIKRALGGYFFVFTLLYVNEGIILINMKYQLFSLLLILIFYTLFFTKRAKNVSR